MLEVREKIIKGKEKDFIDCYSLLHQSLLFSPESDFALIHDLKQKEKYKRKEEQKLY